VLGPIVGALLMELLNVGLATSAIGALRLDHVVFGVLLAITVLAAPRGIVGVLTRRAGR
jgi:ABC-type branched-subunit amino acid transport system permease subunit